MTKTCIIVSPYFPPSHLAGVHRARLLAKHLPAAGWTPIVVCVHEDFYEQSLDPTLAAMFPADIEVVKVRALPAALTRPFGLGEISIRAFRSLRRAITTLIRTRNPQAVFITGSPYYPMLFAPMLKRRFSIPVILDFQDPWVSSWGAAQSRFSKSGLSHLIASHLEPLALRSAAYVTSVSEIQNRELCNRYPWLDPSRMTSIPIGGDPEDFTMLGASPGPAEPQESAPADKFVLSYLGTIWPEVLPTVRLLFRAVRRIRDSKPGLFRRLQIKFVGTTANPNDVTGYRVIPAAEAEGVAECVREIPQRIAYGEALRLMARTDANLIIGSGEPHYTASKIYPALISGRPYLTLLHRDSSAHALAKQAGGGINLSFSTAIELEGLEESLAEAIERLALAPETLGQIDTAAYAPYEARMIAKQFAKIFDLVAA